MKTFKNYLEIIQEADNKLPDNLKIINATPHDIVVNGITYPKTGNVARVSTQYKKTEDKDDLFVREEYGDIVGLGQKERGTLYIVSSIVFSASDRKDLIAPNTGQAIRNDKGHIESVPNFICKWKSISEIM